MPCGREHAVRHVNGAEAERRARSRLRLRRECRHHGVEQWQRHGGAERAADERPSGQMLLDNDHGYCSFACATVLSDGSNRVRIWNTGLSTIPEIIAAKR